MDISSTMSILIILGAVDDVHINYLYDDIYGVRIMSD